MLKPKKHQQLSLKHNAGTPIVYDCSEPGTGKTAVRIWAFEKRHKQLKHKALVLCPRTIMRSVWQSDFFKFAPNIRVLVADANTRKNIDPADCDVYVTNHDAVKWLAKQPKSFWNQFDELIVDESTAYKNPASQRSKALAKIAKNFTYRSCMSGTPNSRSITDVWHQVYVLDEGKTLGKSFYAFRNSVCIPKQVGASANAIQWEDKDGAEEAVFGLLSNIIIRHRLDDCEDIPAMHTWNMGYELTSKQLKAYRQLEEIQIAAMGDKTITAVNAAAVATKLQQVASGAVYTDTGDYTVIDTGRYELILDLVQERKHPLVFFLWKHQRDALVKEAETRGLSYAVIDGGTSDAHRQEYVTAYQNGEYDVLFSHPKSAGHGLTLTKGTSIIWASPTYDLEWFAQGSIRQRRMGQKEKTENLIIVAKDTIDERVLEIMEGKNKRMQNLLQLFNVHTKETHVKTPRSAASAAKQTT